MTGPGSTCAACGRPMSAQGCPQHGWSAGSQPPGSQTYTAAQPYAEPKGYAEPQHYSVPPAQGYVAAGSAPQAAPDAGYGLQPYAPPTSERAAMLPAGAGGQPPPAPPSATGGFRDKLPVLTGIGVLLLVLLVIVQFALLARTNHTLDQAQRSLAAQDKQVKSLQTEQGSLGRRTSALEAQAKGTLNPS